MSIAGKPIKLGIPALIILALAAGLVFWAWGAGGTSGGGGFGDTVMFRGTVEYTVLGPDGKIKQHGIEHNGTKAVFITAVRDAMGSAGGPAAITGDANLFDEIELCAAETVGGTTIDGDICGTLSANLDANPADGANVDSGTNAYTVTKIFTASGGASLIEGFHLCTTAQVTGIACETIEIGAFQETGAINLSTDDTIEIVWTITIS